MLCRSLHMCAKRATIWHSGRRRAGMKSGSSGGLARELLRK